MRWTRSTWSSFAEWCRVVRGRVQVRDGVMGDADVCRGHAFFEAIARKDHLARSPDLPGATVARTENKLTKLVRLNLHGFFSRSHGAGSFRVGLPLAAVRVNVNRACRRADGAKVCD